MNKLPDFVWWGLSIFFLSAACKPAEEELSLFTKLVSDDTDIKFRNVLRETEEFNVMKYGYFYNGGGIAVGDVNHDSLPDIYFTGNMMASHLYLNRGDWTFEEVAEDAGVAAAGLWNTGVTMADVNGDGWLDIYVCRSAAQSPEKRRNLLFINNGSAPGETPTFTESAAQYGLDDPAYSTQASFFDYDRDGDLDMYLLNHSVQEYAGFSRLIGSYKTRSSPFFGDKLYRNEGSRFRDVTQQAGIRNNVLGFGLGVTVTDVNGDHWPDIYISNDYNEEDYLYINRKDGTFQETLSGSMGHVSLFSMGVDGADINNDLLPDIITLDMLPESSYLQKKALGPENYDKYRELMSSGFFPQTMRNMLQLNRGPGPDGLPFFSEIGQLAGVSNTDWSWSVLAADYDNDGWKDLFITNGYMRNYLDMDFLNYVVAEKVKTDRENREVALLQLIDKMPPIEEENYLYQNNGALTGKGLTFTKKTREWGLGGKNVSNAAAYADLDQDGDLDLIVSNVNEEASLYRNNSEALLDHAYLKVLLQGKKPNPFGTGAKVMVYADEQRLLQEMIPVKGFQSSVGYELVFGLGKATAIDSLQVVWPDGTAQQLKNLPVKQTLTLRQSDARPLPPAADAIQQTHFREEPDKLGIAFRHTENSFLDFKRDRLLPQSLSTTGPPMAQGDINKDGLTDIFLGGAHGSPGKIYRQTRQGNFQEIPQPALQADREAEDTDALFLDADGDGDQDLYVVSGGNEFAQNSPALQDRLYLNNGKGIFTRQTDALPKMLTAGSCVTAADLDGDQDADLFVGGRVIPGEYPLAPRSYLLLNDGSGIFTDATQQFAPALMQPGMVTDAQFADLNGDAWADLLLVGEWMPVSAFLNAEGKALQHQPATTGASEGWWKTLEIHDFDNDGDLDAIAGNFGLNNSYQPDSAHPARLIYKDFDQNGSIDPIFSYYIGDTSAFAYSRDELISQIPSIKKKFPDYHSFATASLDEFFTEEEQAGADTLVARLFETVYLENDGRGNFTLRQLPLEVQFSPVYALASVDVNQDGHLDIIAGGNLSQSRVSTGKYDASYGTVLLGDGQGHFSVMPTDQSGLKLTGDVRDISLLDIGGKQYSIFTVNNDSLRIFTISRPLPSMHVQQ